MKLQKGITQISLIIYIIVMIMIVAIGFMINHYFFTNTNTLLNKINPSTEYSKFSSLFLEEVNAPNLKVLEYGQDYIVLDHGVQYTYVAENKGIYRNKIKVCRNVEKCTFETKIKNGNQVVAITMKIGATEQKSVEYTLKTNR